MFDHTVRDFLNHFGLGTPTPCLGALRAITRCFAKLPYENATKIIKKKESLQKQLSPLRYPDEVFGDYLKYGTGGTCFSLCYFLIHILHQCGFAAHIVMADRSYGENTHCALLCHLEGEEYLVDPGFLLEEPLHLEKTRQFTRPYFLGILVFRALAPDCLEVSTQAKDGRLKQRYVLKRTPVSLGEFIPHWIASFEFAGLNEVVVTFCEGGRQHYVRGDYYKVASKTGEFKRKLQGGVEGTQGLLAGIHPDVLCRAREIAGKS